MTQSPLLENQGAYDDGQKTRAKKASGFDGGKLVASQKAEGSLIQAEMLKKGGGTIGGVSRAPWAFSSPFPMGVRFKKHNDDGGWSKRKSSTWAEYGMDSKTAQVSRRRSLLPARRGVGLYGLLRASPLLTRQSVMIMYHHANLSC
jgi:hypothetical protein